MSPKPRLPSGLRKSRVTPTRKIALTTTSIICAEVMQAGSAPVDAITDQAEIKWLAQHFLQFGLLIGREQRVDLLLGRFGGCGNLTGTIGGVDTSHAAELLADCLQ